MCLNIMDQGLNLSLFFLFFLFFFGNWVELVLILERFKLLPNKWLVVKEFNFGTKFELVQKL